MSIEPMAHGGMIGLRGGGYLLPYQMNTGGYVPMVYANGGYIPAYGIGGFFKKVGKGLLKAAPIVAGAINPALGAGVGALISGIENKSLKSALMGGMKGYLGGKALSKGLKSASLFGKTADEIAEGNLAGSLKGGLGALIKGKGLGQFGGAAFDYLSDPKKVAALYPMLAELSEQQAQESPGGQIPSAYAAESQAVMPQSATPGYVAPAQGYATVAGGGLISPPGYRRGGGYEDENGDEPDRYSPPRRRRRATSKRKTSRRKKVKSPPRRKRSVSEEVKKAIQPVVPRTIAATPAIPQDVPEDITEPVVQ
jgi:hypothetical protein